MRAGVGAQLVEPTPQLFEIATTMVEPDLGLVLPISSAIAKCVFALSAISGLSFMPRQHVSQDLPGLAKFGSFLVTFPQADRAF